MQDDILDALCERLAVEHGCHTIILYGSRARGDAEADSDYDLIGFHDGAGPVRRETGRWHGALLDVFVYPAERLNAPDDTMLHVRGGRVLRQREDLGTQFLAALERVYASAPPALAADEIEARRNWASKMLDRAARGHIEGNYRRVWLLTTLLENYFVFRGRRYPGPKEAFEALAASDPEAHALFDAALQPGAAHGTLSALVTYVNEAA